MKKQIITLIALFSVFGTMAQNNYVFIVKEYDPDAWDTVPRTQAEIIHRIDINDDGNYDFMYWGTYDYDERMFVRMMAREGACSLVKANEWPAAYNCYVNIDTPFNDTTLRWLCHPNPSGSSFPELLPEKLTAHYHRYDTMTYKSGIREGVEGEYCYGWVEVYAVNTYDTVYFHVARTCYCTIPNYPLRWGQTKLTDVVENGENSSLLVYPNPSSDLVSIAGSNLRRIEVYNTLGQRIITQQVNGNLATINLNNQPTGVYFVTVTDTEGRRCVKKVVKQ